jgi:hypothetical protein
MSGPAAANAQWSLELLAASREPYASDEVAARPGYRPTYVETHLISTVRVDCGDGERTGLVLDGGEPADRGPPCPRIVTPRLPICRANS